MPFQTKKTFAKGKTGKPLRRRSVVKVISKQKPESRFTKSLSAKNNKVGSVDRRAGSERRQT